MRTTVAAAINSAARAARLIYAACTGHTTSVRANCEGDICEGNICEGDNVTATSVRAGHSTTHHIEACVDGMN